jgi:Fe-Mn family superoxide dismutase
MATTHPTESTPSTRNGIQKAMAVDQLQRVNGLSRIVDRDIEILKMNVRLYDGRDDAWSSAWERLEGAWETIRSGLAEDSASIALPEDVSAGNGATAAADKVAAPMTVVSTVPAAQKSLNWFTGVLEPVFSSRTGEVLRWLRDPARFAEFRAASRKVRSFASSAVLSGARHVSNAWCGLRESVRSRTPAQGDSSGVSSAAWEESARLRLESAFEAAKSKLEQIESAARPLAQFDEPTTSSQDMPFALEPLPWVLGALSPVISSRTMMLHRSHHAQCIESANRLARVHKNLAGRSSLEIVRWGCDQARGTELLSTASEAWNHSFYWQCLTPTKKRPSGKLGEALERAFGDFSNFADTFARAGAMHVGSGWLWLTANSRRQLRILTTSDADCPEADGRTCLLAIDLWEHAYFLDHQNRRREYLDALIDRRLDWDFAEQRYCLVLQRVRIDRK